MRTMRAAFEAAKVRKGEEGKPIVKQVLRVMERSDQRRAAAKQRRGGK